MLATQPGTVPASESDQVNLRVSVTKRNGDVNDYDPNKIIAAIEKALAANIASDSLPAHSSKRINEKALKLGSLVHEKIITHLENNNSLRIHIETIQDIVELILMKSGEYELAKKYVLYREKKNASRKEHLSVDLPTGNLNKTANTDEQLQQLILDIYPNAVELLDFEGYFTNVKRGIFKGINSNEILTIIQLNASSMVKYDPGYSKLAAQALRRSISIENKKALNLDETSSAKELFIHYFEKGVRHGMLDPKVIEIYDLDELFSKLDESRDEQFTYVGLKTLFDRYLLHDDGLRYESPQILFMRVAMGLAHQESEPTKYAIKFYDLLSSFDFMSSTPTLFNSATINPQLSSCYLTSVEDDLGGIYDSIKDNALLSKFAGGLGNSWTKVRGLGSHIKGTNGESQGVIPFLKVANDTAVAVNQGGKRKGAVCAYLETWHIDIEDFLELRKNTGDDRRRTHDMNTANWIPDLFMERVAIDGEWTLFSPEETPELHELYGEAFRKKYEQYEKQAADGLMANTKVVKATDLWRKMLGMLFETGHPWITFKDPCNIRSPQKHSGIIHSSNLCTEITLNTSDTEIAVCNLGSINLSNHFSSAGVMDKEKLSRTVRLAVRMLDNVIDYNLYPVEKARTSNLAHRPIGLGQMGFQDVLYKSKTPYASEDAIKLSGEIAEFISFHAIKASAELANEKGTYQTFTGSEWSKGMLPQDTLSELSEYRGKYFESTPYATRQSSSLDWDGLRKQVVQGMRNSNLMAIAPTATISNITGVGQSAEPTYQQIFVKSNLSGEFTHTNEYLVNDLKDLGLWDQNMAEQIIDNDGSIQDIPQIPESLKAIYKNCFEYEPQWLVECAAARQTWIDQGISLNLYMAEPSGRDLDNLYKLAWKRGLKTTYYLRSVGATSARDSNSSSKTISQSQSSVCSITDQACDACQ